MSNDGSVKSIPAVRRMVINDPSQLPLNYGTTPGGSLFSTTPGGIVNLFTYSISIFVLCICKSSRFSDRKP